MGKTKIKKKYSRSAYKTVLTVLCGVIIILVIACILLIHSVNEKKSEYDEYLKMTNSVSAEKNLDDK